MIVIRMNFILLVSKEITNVLKSYLSESELPD